MKMRKDAKLTFEDGVFFLENASPQPTHAAYWQKTISGNYASTDIRGAIPFLSKADDRAAAAIDRYLMKWYESSPRFPLPSFLDRHQKAGVTWILSRSRSYLAHAPGAGKTAQAIVASILARGDEQTVFIVPPQLTKNWEREIFKFVELTRKNLNKYSSFRSEINLEHTTVGVLPDTYDRFQMNWGADFLVVPDSMLTRDWVIQPLSQMKIKLIAVDEASRFKDFTAQRTCALFGGRLKTGFVSPGLIQNARHAVLLDGSPMLNRPIELWAPLAAMCPEAIQFMDYNDFGFRYGGATLNDFNRWEFKGASNLGELKARIQEDFMHVVSEGELSHPERLRTLLYMTKDFRSPEHRRWEKKNLSQVNLNDLNEEKPQNGELAHFRKELGLRKAPWVASYVFDRFQTRSESILVFAWHREVCEKISDALKAKIGKEQVGLIFGGTKAPERERMFADFQSGALKILVMNIAAAGRGHNLQRADRVVFAEFSWGNETNIQAEKRASRRGSDKEFVRCDYIVSPNSMDEIILKAVMRKAAVVKKVIG